jgi:glutathione S-transferase
MIDTLLTYWDLALAQCLPDWRSGQPTIADIILVALIGALFALACWQCVIAVTRGDSPEAERIKRSILAKERPHAD